MRTVVSAALAAVVVGGSIAGCGDPRGKPDALTWCPAVPGYTVECGQVQRPLVADQPDLGTVDIGYALVRHGKDVPSAGTVVPNPGGPGVPMIAHAAEAVAVSEHLLADHDLLLIDPRGTGVSSPLDCGIDARRFQLGTREQQLTAVEHCGAQLGSRAAGYTSAAAADDFDAVRERLGIPKLVLYGISYGTYLMPVYAQRHPDHVQSIVLTGAYSPDMNQLGTANAEAVSLALQRICERSRACDGNAAVADLAAVAQRVRTRPITVATDHGPVLLDEGKLGNLVFEAGTSNVGAHPEQLVPLGMLPAALHGAVRGDDRGLAEFVRATTDEPAYENIGSYVAVTCNDYPTLWSPDANLPQREQQYRQALANAPAGSGAFSAEGFGAALRDGGDSCIRWPGLKNHQRPDQMREPLPNVPVLVLSGDLDAVTPDANGKRAAARFANATFVSVPNTGHVPDLEPSGCVTGIVAEFVRTGASGSTACLSAIPPIAVTPVAD
ncbi:MULTISPECIES: alpha/beta fold hydrolase [unclassified Nocardia]|uniref:alpha/beta fold hydrolase n=1 Tax=unclassified Nocardia TaxID=2637762 RepID=UPI001CE49FDC|nr:MULTISPECIES: alpha/beta fold hydrolase [unclassified Nocardia]